MKIATRISKLPKYVGGKPIDELQRELGIDRPIKLASNENPNGPSPKSLEALSKSILDVASYPDGDSYHLKRKICEKENILPNQIVIGNGSNEILELISHAFIEKDDEVIMGEYCFIVYPIVAMLSEARIIRSKMPNMTHDIQDIIDLVSDNTKVIFIANPNNPTGTKVPKEEIYKLLDSIPSNILVVVDEAYCEYLIKNQRMDVSKDLTKWKNLVIVKTFSKIYGLAGLRIGFAMGDNEIIDKIQKPREPFNVNSLAQSAAVAAMDDEEHLEKSFQMNISGMLFLKTEIVKMGLKIYPSHANFILLDFGCPAKNIYEELLKRGVIVRPLENYNLPNCLRITVGTQDENERFISGLKEVLGVLR